MRALIRKKLHRIAGYLEISVACIITVMIAVSIVNMIIHILQNPLEVQDADRFYEFMNDALSLIIGIEFLKMIIIPTSDNVIETLLFAVSRHIILDHGIPVMIVGVICIVLLFFVKKYLFSNFEETEHFAFRGGLPVKTVDGILDTDLSTDKKNETISEFVIQRLKEENIPLEKGALVKRDNIVFRVGKVDSNGDIKKVFVNRED